ncbi:MAG: sel1 repeat family protein [Magnetococcales bacterium]|nr:sel1 repeat family protein [Magnetococcales bacterium]
MAQGVPWGAGRGPGKDTLGQRLIDREELEQVRGMAERTGQKLLVEDEKGWFDDMKDALNPMRSAQADPFPRRDLREPQDGPSGRQGTWFDDVPGIPKNWHDVSDMALDLAGKGELEEKLGPKSPTLPDKLKSLFGKDNRHVRDAVNTMMFLKAGEYGYPEAYSYLASLYQFGVCFEQSWIDSLAMHRKAVDAGYGWAGVVLADNYLFGSEGYPRDWTQALYWLIRASVNGEWRAPYRKLYQIWSGMTGS